MSAHVTVRRREPCREPGFTTIELLIASSLLLDRHGVPLPRWQPRCVMGWSGRWDERI